VAGLIAGTLYAAYRPAIYVEQHLVLEPFVVMLVLLGAYVWLGRDPAITARRATTAGVLLAAAGLVKLSAGLALLALLVSPPREGKRRALVSAVAGAVGVTAIVIVPFAFSAGPSQLWNQLILAQAQRPGGDSDGGSVSGLGDRLLDAGRFGLLGAEVVPDSTVWLLLLVVAAAAVWALVYGGRDGRFWVICLAVLLGPPLVAPDWYGQYPVPGAAAMTALLGAFSVTLFAWLAQRRPSVSRVLAVALAAVLAASLIDVTRDAWLQRPRTSVDFGARVQAEIAWNDCIFADPP
jgi:Glycosyltransferase family 87